MRKTASALALAALLGGVSAGPSPTPSSSLPPRRALRDTSRLASAEDLPNLLQPLAAPPAPAHAAGLFAVNPAAAAAPSPEYEEHVRQAELAARHVHAAPDAVSAAALPLSLSKAEAAAASTAATMTAGAAAATSRPLLVPLPPTAAEAAAPLPISPLKVRPPVHETSERATQQAQQAQEQTADEAEAEEDARHGGGDVASSAETRTQGDNDSQPANVAAAAGFAAAVSAKPSHGGAAPRFEVVEGEAAGPAAGAVAPTVKASVAPASNGRLVT